MRPFHLVYQVLNCSNLTQMHVAGRKEAAHDTCCVKCGGTLCVFFCGVDHTLRVLLRRAGNGLRTADTQTKRLLSSIQIDECHYISGVSGVEVAHERVWMPCDRYDETRRRARLANIYTLIVFFLRVAKCHCLSCLLGSVGIDRVGKVNETSGAETDGTGLLSHLSRSVVLK